MARVGWIGVVLALGGAGCDREVVVSLRGTVFGSSDPSSAALPDASLRFLDFEGRPIGRARTGADGGFRVDLPGGDAVFVEITADGYATTTFPGVLGIDAVQQVEPRALYGTSVAELDDWRARFAGCDRVDDPDGALVIGELELYGFTDPVTGGQPTISAGVARVYVSGHALSACYLDEAGLVHDPEAQYTGNSGIFAVFGVPPGVHELEVRGDIPGESDPNAIYPVWVPEGGGVVAPWFPAQIELL